jgi:ribosomal protein S18 acetylase RimI-like enzyme
MDIILKKFSNTHKAWAQKLLEDHWVTCSVVSRGKIHRADLLPGYVAIINDEPAGLLTYHIAGNDCEVVTLNSLKEGAGIGTKLIRAVRESALHAGCRRLWLITTNDNLPAIRFYQKRGFVIVTVHRDAIEESRKLKPQIPKTGLDGVPIRDEIELEMQLSPSI